MRIFLTILGALLSLVGVYAAGDRENVDSEAVKDRGEDGVKPSSTTVSMTVATLREGGETTVVLNTRSRKFEETAVAGKDEL